MNYPKGSMGTQENKNFNAVKIIIAAVWIGVHAICLLLSNNKFGPVSAHPLLWLMPVASLGYTIWLIAKTGTDTLSENNGYYIAGAVLLFLSCGAVSYCPIC